MHNPASLPSRPVIVGETGSFAHGLNIETSDHDYLGLYTDRPDQLIGLKPLRKGVRKGDQPEGVRLSAGESETAYHAVRKYAALAAQGNPTMLTLLFTPILTVPDEIGLQANRDMFLSKRVARTHVGYADSIIAQLTGKKAPHPYRPELIEKFGFDCYLGDTEFLTEHGWRTYHQVGNDRLATINQVTGCVEFQSWSERVCKPYSGPILSHHSRYSAWAVTPNHRMWTAKMHRGASGGLPFEYAPDRHAGWGFVRADEMRRLYWYQRVAANARSDEYPVSDAYLALIGAYVSEGHVVKRRKDGSPSVLGFTQAVDGDLVDIIESIRIEFPMREYQYSARDARRKPYILWTLADRSVATAIVGECGAGSAAVRLPSWAWQLSGRQAGILIDAMMAGDGTMQRCGTEVYYTTSRQLADDLQVLAICAGRRSTISGPYRYEYNKSDMYQVRVHKPGKEIMPFPGRETTQTDVTDAEIVCFTVPNETLVTRRNGRVAMHGNTKHTMHALRILLQGIELLTTGHMELPMAPPLRQMLLGVRHGLYSKQFCLDWIKDLRSSIDKLDSILPDEPDYNRINHWLIDVHNKEWEYA